MKLLFMTYGEHLIYALEKSNADSRFRTGVSFTPIHARPAETQLEKVAKKESSPERSSAVENIMGFWKCTI